MSLIALWDLGNVVVQWSPERIHAMLNLPATKLDILKTELFEKLWLDLDRGITDEAAVAAQLGAETDLSVEDVLQCFETIRESLVDFPESIDLIHQMKAAGIPMYVLSNMSTVNAAFLRQRSYFDLFDGIVISAHEKLMKPETELFQVVLDRYRLDAEKIVFMDDSLSNINAARSLGMQGVHFDASERCYAAVRKHFNL